MKLVTGYFARKKIYRNLAVVCERSAKKFMTNVVILKLFMPDYIDHQRDAAFAFIEIAEYVLKENEPVIVTGIDSLFLKPLNCLFKNKFDFAVSVRNHKIKYNTGLWAYRPTTKSKIFLSRWIENTKLLMERFDKYESSIRLYGGIDQLSLLITMIYNQQASILEIPCQIWNATQSEWRFIDENTRMIHIKSELRDMISNKNIEYDKKNIHLKDIIDKWRSFINVTTG